VRPWAQYLIGGAGAVVLILLMTHPRAVLGVCLLLWLTHRGHRAIKRGARRKEEGDTSE
jgi:hypothetical protein